MKQTYYRLAFPWGGRPTYDKYPSVEEAINAIYQRGYQFGRTSALGVYDKFQIIRVEETQTLSRREAITTGDLSLLNKGPVVIQNIYGLSYIGLDGHWVADVNDALVFSGISDTLFGYRDIPGRGTSRVVPIREISGETTVTETVLA